MDEADMRSCVDEHAEAVERGDMESVGADFIEELQAQLPQIAESLPQPVTKTEVVSLEVGDSESVAVIRYTGEDSELTVRSYWQDRGSRPLIVRAEPLS